MAAACTVKFVRSRHGVDAVLMRKSVGASLNSLALGHKPSMAALRSAKKRLMNGCAELVRDHKRHTRRR